MVEPGIAEEIEAFFLRLKVDTSGYKFDWEEACSGLIERARIETLNFG